MSIHVDEDGVVTKFVITAGDRMVQQLRAWPVPHIEPIMASASDVPFEVVWPAGMGSSEAAATMDERVALFEVDEPAPAYDVEETVGWMLLTPRDRTQIMVGAGIMACDLHGDEFPIVSMRFMEREALIAGFGRVNCGRFFRKDLTPYARLPITRWKDMLP